MEIYINDLRKEVPEGTTLAKALAECNVPEKGAAAALNGKIAKRVDWDSITLAQNDKIIVISAAYGG